MGIVKKMIRGYIEDGVQPLGDNHDLGYIGVTFSTNKNSVGLKYNHASVFDYSVKEVAISFDYDKQCFTIFGGNKEL